MVQEYAQLLVEVAGGRDLREAVLSSAKRVGLDLGEWDSWCAGRLNGLVRSLSLCIALSCCPLQLTRGTERVLRYK